MAIVRHPPRPGARRAYAAEQEEERERTRAQRQCCADDGETAAAPLQRGQGPEEEWHADDVGVDAWEQGQRRRARERL
jgi:hypothetical protein